MTSHPDDGPAPPPLGADPLPVAELSEQDLASVGLRPDDLTPDRVAALARTRRALATLGHGEPPPRVVRRWQAALAQLPPPPPAPPADTADAPVPSAGDGPGDATDRTPHPAEPAEPHPAEPAEPRHGVRRYGNEGSRGEPTASRPGLVSPVCWPPSRRARASGLALLAAAAAALLALPAVGMLSGSDEPLGGASGPRARLPAAHGAVPPAAPSQPDQPGGGMSLTSKDVSVGGQDYGPLTDPARRAACLARVGAPGVTALGGRQVSWAGRAGVLLVLPSSVPGQPRIVVVTPDCGPASGALLADFPAHR